MEDRYIFYNFQERFGRRWSHVALLFSATVCMAVLCTLANHHEDDIVSMWAVNILCFVGKFVCTMSFYMFYVQSVEIFPTCIRSSGMGFCSFISNILGLPGPTVALLGRQNKRIPYLIMGAVSVVSAISASFLPETRGCHLPETVSAAASFGNDQKYFSWPKKKTLPTSTKEEQKNSIN